MRVRDTAPKKQTYKQANKNRTIQYRAQIDFVV